MENYDNFFNFNDQGRTPVYHTPDPVDPKDNKSGKKFTVITVLFVVIALIMCIAIVANVVVLASMKTQVSQDYADSMVDAVREEYHRADRRQRHQGADHLRRRRSGHQDHFLHRSSHRRRQ